MSRLIRNVFPGGAANDVADDRLVNAVAVSDGLLGHLRIEGADVPHVLLGEFGAAVFDAKRMPSLLDLIGGIVCGRANEQVGRIAARRIVAAMQHVFAVWNRAVNAFPRKAMRTNLSTFLVADNAVAIAVNGADPRPAFVGLARTVEVSEPICEWTGAGSVTAGFRAERLSLSAWRSQFAVSAE